MCVLLDAIFAPLTQLSVHFLNGEFNGQADLHIGDTKTKQSE